MTQSTSSTSSQPWGMISLGSGILALFILTAGCMVGMSYFSLPVAVLGLLAAEFEAQRARRGERAEMPLAAMGIVFSTITLAAHLVLTMAGLLLVLSYLLFFVGLVLFA